MFGLRRKSLADLDLQLPFSEVRKRARILVVDDDEDAFPYKLLQKEGYNVQYLPCIENLRVLEDGEYDLIVLDIYGVASEKISDNDGLGVLEHIKRYNPAQLVIAYSGQQYDLSKASFWSMADDYLGKPSSLITCKEKIDTLLKRSYTPDHYWQAIVSVLQDSGVPQKRLRQFESCVVKSVQKGSRPNAEEIAQLLSIAHHTAAVIGVLVQVIMRFHGNNP